MTHHNNSPIGLIAGKGKFPLIFAQEAQRNNQQLVVIALKEEVNEELSPYAKALHTISVSKLDSIIQTLKKEGVKEAVMVGRVEHTKLFSDLIPDFRVVKLLLSLKDRRADTILSAVADELKKDGITLLPSVTFLANLLPEPGILTKRKPNESEEKDIEFGIRMAKGLSSLDLGQTVVVKGRTVLAIEALEGTDECIRRGAQLGGDNVVVVKSAKPKQDIRFDVPVMGANTIKVFKEAHAKVLAIEARKTLILEKDKCIEEANKSGLTIVAWED